METLEYELIFSQQFPDARAILKKAEELPHAAPAGRESLDSAFEDMVRQAREKYTIEPRPDAAEKSKQFISQAIAVCQDFEIDTKIHKRRHEVVAAMDLYCGWYGGPVKRALDALLRLADDFTLSRNTNKPEYIRISMAYRTHDIYSCGEKMIW